MLFFRPLTGYIENEVNMNTENDCKNSCTDYKLAENHVCFNGTYCDQQPPGPERERSICRGKIVDCDFIGSDFQVCKSVSHSTEPICVRSELTKPIVSTAKPKSPIRSHQIRQRKHTRSRSSFKVRNGELSSRILDEMVCSMQQLLLLL